MSFSFSSLVRLIVFMALGATTLAIGLSKLDPPKPGWRTRVASRYYNLNEYFMNFTERTPRWLDSDTGRVVSAPLADGDVLEAASSAPWVDQKGQYQVAGRWSSRTTMGPMSISTDFGLARYAFPSGRLIDHVSTDIVPVGPPAWFPGTRARILFTSGDGNLYHFAFEAEAHEKMLDPEAKGNAKPIPVEWRCPRPGLGKVFLSDLTWPEDPRLGDYVIVSLREQSPESEALRSFTGTKLWWLKLDHAGTGIVGAGRLLLGDEDHRLESPPSDQRSPTVGTLADGRPAVAYLTETVGKPGWDLRVALIEFDGDHHIPRGFEARSRVLSGGCQPAHPSFSADGRWINAIGESSLPDGRIVRLSLSKAFAPSE